MAAALTQPLDRDDPEGLAHALAALLKTAIFDGELRPGERLPTEAELTRSHAVSRTVVREAVSRLRAAGLVDTVQGRGSVVCATAASTDAPPDERFVARDRDDLRALMGLRMGVECEAAALAAAQADGASVASMRRALAEFEDVEGHPSRIAELDFAFHEAVARASGNRFLLEVLQAIGPRSIVQHRALLGDGSEVTDSRHRDALRHEHAAIAAAVERGDGEAARAAMRVHLARSLAALG